MKYDAVLFDLDGVLVTGRETAPGVYRAATERMLRAFGCDSETKSWTDELESPRSGEEFRTACDRWGLPAEAAWGYRERAATGLEFSRMQDRTRTAFTDTKVLSELGEEIALGICSNNRHPTVHNYIEEFGWADLMRGYRGRFPTLRDYDRRKPNPTYLKWMIARLEVSDPLFVGDRISDIRTAERVGCDAALLTREGAFPTGSPTPTYRIRSLAELCDLQTAEVTDHS